MTQQNQTLEVALYLRGNDLDPAEISQQLGLEPTKSRRKGDEQLTATNRKITAKIGLWALAAKSRSDDLSALIDELTSRLGDRVAAPLLSIPGVQEAFLDVFIAIDGEDGGGTCEFQLSAENLHALNRMGVATRFTVAVVARK